MHRDGGAEPVTSARDDLESTPYDEQVQQQQERSAKEPALLGERGEREVGRVLRQIVEPGLRRARDTAAIVMSRWFRWTVMPLKLSIQNEHT